MNPRHLTRLALATAIALPLATPLVAHADPGSKGGRGGPGHFFERADTNDDGAVDAAEAVTLSRAMFARLDADGDGFIVIEEISRRGDRDHHRRNHGSSAARMEQKFGEFDADGDGGIARAEFRAFAEARHDARIAKAKERFATLDTDGDGKLTEDEFLSAVEQRLAKMLSRADRRFAALDDDDDGSVSAFEFAARGDESHGPRHARHGSTHGKRHGGSGDRAEHARARFEAADTDEDGRLSAAEFEARGKAMFEALDADGDGRVLRDEIAPHGPRAVEN